MGDFFLGEIRAFPYPSANNIPSGWTPCDGRLMQIQQNAALYSLLGVQYGGNGTTTFALPDLRGRVVVGSGTSQSGTVYKQGVAGGTETVVLTPQQLPPHTHSLAGNTETGNKAAIANNSFATCGTSQAIPTAQNLYASPTTPGVALNTGSVGQTGSSQGHSNMQPSQVAVYCIATTGIYPMRP